MTSSPCGILTLMPPDIGGWYIYRQPTIVVFRVNLYRQHQVKFSRAGNYHQFFFVTGTGTRDTLIKITCMKSTSI